MITLQQKFDMFIILRYLNIHKKFTFSPQNIQIYLHNYECGEMIYMKKYFVFLMTIIMLCGCTHNKQYDKDFQVGFIITTEKKKDSDIVYLDNNLNEIYRQNEKLPTLGDSMNIPMIKDGKMTLVPNGLYLDNNEQKVTSLDFKTGKLETYDVPKFNILNAIIKNDYIYTLNNSNGIEYLTLSDKKGHIIKEITDKDYIMTEILDYNDKILVFKSINNEEHIKSYICVYDLNLHLIKEINISDYGYSQSKAIIHNHKLYFVNSSDNNHSIGILDLDNEQLEKIELDMIPNEIAIFKNKLYVSSGIHSQPGNKICIIQLDDIKMKIVEVNTYIDKMISNQDGIYTMYSEDGKIDIRKYDLDSCKELNKATFQYDSNTPYYPSVLFSNQ